MRVLALRTSLHTYMCSQVYIYSITDTFVYEPMLCKLTCVCNMYPCECSRLERHCIHRPIHTYTHKYTYIKNHITDTLVYQPVLCTLTLVCALVSAHTYNLFAYRYSQVLVYIHRIMDSFVYEPTLCEHTYMFVPLRLLTVRSSLYT